MHCNISIASGRGKWCVCVCVFGWTWVEYMSERTWVCLQKIYILCWFSCIVLWPSMQINKYKQEDFPSIHQLSVSSFNLNAACVVYNIYIFFFGNKQPFNTLSRRAATTQTYDKRQGWNWKRKKYIYCTNNADFWMLLRHTTNRNLSTSLESDLTHSLSSLSLCLLIRSRVQILPRIGYIVCMYMQQIILSMLVWICYCKTEKQCQFIIKPHKATNKKCVPQQVKDGLAYENADIINELFKAYNCSVDLV